MIQKEEINGYHHFFLSHQGLIAATQYIMVAELLYKGKIPKQCHWQLCVTSESNQELGRKGSEWGSSESGACFGEAGST